MNRKNINEFRSALGLQPFAAPERDTSLELARKRRQAQNRAARAAANQALKSSRSRGGK